MCVRAGVCVVKAFVVLWLTAAEKDTMTVQILDEAICISHSTSAIKKYPPILPPAMIK